MLNKDSCVPANDYVTAGIYHSLFTTIDVVNEIIKKGYLSEVNCNRLNEFVELLNTFRSRDDIFQTLSEKHNISIYEVFVRYIPILMVLTNTNSVYHSMFRGSYTIFQICVKISKIIAKDIPFSYIKRLEIANLSGLRVRYDKRLFMLVYNNKVVENNISSFPVCNARNISQKEEIMRIEKCFQEEYVMPNENILWAFPSEMCLILEYMINYVNGVRKKHNRFVYFEELEDDLSDIFCLSSIEKIIDNLLDHTSGILIIQKVENGIPTYRLNTNIRFRSSGKKLETDDLIVSNERVQDFYDEVNKTMLLSHNSNDNEEENEVELEKNANGQTSASGVGNAEASVIEPVSDSNLENYQKLSIEEYDLTCELRNISHDNGHFRDLNKIIKRIMKKDYQVCIPLVESLKGHGLLRKAGRLDWFVDMTKKISNTGKSFFTSWKLEIPEIPENDFFVNVSEEACDLFCECRRLQDNRKLVLSLRTIANQLFDRKYASYKITKIMTELFQSKAIICLGGPSKHKYHYFVNPRAVVLTGSVDSEENVNKQQLSLSAQQEESNSVVEEQATGVTFPLEKIERPVIDAKNNSNDIEEIVPKAVAAVVDHEKLMTAAQADLIIKNQAETLSLLRRIEAMVSPDNIREVVSDYLSSVFGKK